MIYFDKTAAQIGKALKLYFINEDKELENAIPLNGGKFKRFLSKRMIHSTVSTILIQFAIWGLLSVSLLSLFDMSDSLDRLMQSLVVILLPIQEVLAVFWLLELAPTPKPDFKARWFTVTSVFSRHFTLNDELLEDLSKGIRKYEIASNICITLLIMIWGALFSVIFNPSIYIPFAKITTTPESMLMVMTTITLPSAFIYLILIRSPLKWMKKAEKILKEKA